MPVLRRLAVAALVTALVAAYWIGRSTAPAPSRALGPELLSMRPLVLNAVPDPSLGRWNHLLGKPLVAVEYRTAPEEAVGDRTVYVYNARTGDCETVIHSPMGPGDQMLITWAPCK